jgi:ectoine hydroxylase-related dioxygenase (phytanoyl-CoA dioxygenase family)
VGPFASIEEDHAWRRRHFVRGGGHVDAEYTLQHWERTPRQIFLQFWLCLEDWTERKGALRFIPASHTLIAAANSALPKPPLSRLAGVHGTSTRAPKDGGERELLPAEARGKLQRMESRPVLARRGQAVAFTAGVLHDSSPNFTTAGVRKRLTWTYWPDTAHEFLVNETQLPAPGLAAAMRALMPVERRHLVEADAPSGARL